MFNNKKTARGFDYSKFEDINGEQCSFQESSSASNHCIWLGIDDANPQILASLASVHGVDTDQTTGWIKYPIPDDVMITTRMHLTRKQSFKLAVRLLKFALMGKTS